MPDKEGHNWTSIRVEHDDALCQRRVRQITSIQIRNLTPFPMRDAFASAIAQPAESAQFTPSGHHSDDLDLALASKRSRKMSASSVGSVGTMRSVGVLPDAIDESEGETAHAERGRRPTASKVSFSPDTRHSSNSTLVRRASAYENGTIRPSRMRKNSSASVLSFPRPSGAAASSGFTFSEPSSSALQLDTTQKGLEKVVKSRLVETFVAITIPSPAHDDSTTSSPDVPETTRKATKPDSRPTSPSNLRTTFTNPHTSPQSPKSSHSPIASNPPSPSRPKYGHTGSIASTNGHAIPNGSTSSESPPPSSMSFSSSDHAHPSPSPLKNSPNPPPAPDYLTSIHRPSTAPSFAIDGDSFAPTAQLSGYVLHVDIVGRLTDEGWGDPSGKGKGKQRAPEDGEWAPLARWEVDLRRLIPLADTPPARLPSNTLLVTLAPKGETFYLPHDYAGLPKDAVRSRPSSPTGYSSDTDKPRARSLSKGARRSRDPSRRRGRRHDAAKTASYHDLVKLSTLQACIADTDRSLADIVAEVSRAVDDDGFAIVKREVSEREFRIKTLKEAREEVEDASDDLRSRIDARREELRQRRATLARARELQDADSRASAALEDELATERSLLAGMRACLPPVRSGLIATVGSIFPIEIAAPADLLFTVLGVPLPIPLESKDPAPPLALPKHKDVTEDAVATALGYAAQVVQLLAAYLGRRLVYPITCVGSRSLIKDEISAMVGPRMFPLFSKGVDTYRFEYAVFLLNKDIEMLMSDRDLRALDMRHTLPNLKNLLLTLTDGESARIAPPHNTSMSSLVELETAVRAASPETTSTPVTPRAAPSKLPLDGSSASSITSSEPRTGTSTPPTPESSTFKKSRQYLPDLSPLAGFWRGRPSTASKITVKPVAEGPEERETEEDEEDRRTLREVPLEGDHHGEGKANGHANGHSAAEKVHTPEPSPAAVANVG